MRIARVSAAIILAAVSTLIIWLSLASLAFIWSLGFWLNYTWPDKLWMWARYAFEAPPNAIVHRWLIITGFAAAAPVLVIGGLVAVVIWRSSRRRADDQPVFGEVAFADRNRMRSGGIRSTRALLDE